MDDYDIFREQLSIKYPSYGHALWNPSPSNPVNVGDVGFIRTGTFHRLFNALLSAEDQVDQPGCLGVPEHYEPLVPKVSDHIHRSRPLSSNHYCSDGIAVELESNVQAFSPDDFERISFLGSRRRGAVLSLPVDARREDTLAKGDFGGWMIREIDRWFAFARGLGLGIERMEELILVTGCDHTRSWTNIAFFGSQNNAQASFGVKVVYEPAISINWQPLPESVQGAVLSRGPGGVDLPEDQCVFIRGFRVARTFWKLQKHLRAAADPSPDPDGYDGEPDFGIVSIPATPEYQDPLYLLQDHVAERAPDCDMVLIHDDDLAMIDEIRHGALPETLEPDVMMDLLRRSNIEIREDLCNVSLTNPPSGPSVDMAIAKVAMLSKTFQNHNTASPPQGSLSATQNIDFCYSIDTQRKSLTDVTVGAAHQGQRDLKMPKCLTNSNIFPVKRHKEYFLAEGDVTVKVEDTVFRIHKFFLYRESAYFRTLFRSPSIPCNDPPGSSLTNPVVLEDTSSEAFAGLCWIFYNPNHSIYTTTVDKWVEILALAQRWAFREVEQLCIRELEKLPIEPVEKIHIYQALHIDRLLLAGSFGQLTLRPQPITLEEGRKLGMETTIQIAQARELSRNTKLSTIQVNDSELRSVIQDVFGVKLAIGLINESVAFTPTSPAKRPSKKKK